MAVAVALIAAAHETLAVDNSRQAERAAHEIAVVGNAAVNYGDSHSGQIQAEKFQTAAVEAGSLGACCAPMAGLAYSSELLRERSGEIYRILGSSDNSPSSATGSLTSNESQQLKNRTQEPVQIQLRKKPVAHSSGGLDDNVSRSAPR